MLTSRAARETNPRAHRLDLGLAARARVEMPAGAGLHCTCCIAIWLSGKLQIKQPPQYPPPPQHPLFPPRCLPLLNSSDFGRIDSIFLPLTPAFPSLAVRLWTDQTQANEKSTNMKRRARWKSSFVARADKRQQEREQHSHASLYDRAAVAIPRCQVALINQRSKYAKLCRIIYRWEKPLWRTCVENGSLR